MFLESSPSTRFVFLLHPLLSILLRADRRLSFLLFSNQLHCWQLSESKIVASVHVLVKPGSDYMSTVQGIRKVLHDYGIHSSTIQVRPLRFSLSLFIRS